MRYKRNKNDKRHDDNRLYLWSIYMVVSSMISTFHVLINLILIGDLQGRYYDYIGRNWGRENGKQLSSSPQSQLTELGFKACSTSLNTGC